MAGIRASSSIKKEEQVQKRFIHPTSLNTPLDKYHVQHNQTTTPAKHGPSNYLSRHTVGAEVPLCIPPRANTAFQPAVDTVIVTAQATQTEVVAEVLGTHTSTEPVALGPATHI